jgi:hypothetical protein
MGTIQPFFDEHGMQKLKVWPAEYADTFRRGGGHDYYPTRT